MTTNIWQQQPFILGILLGLGAAIPIGPVNLEIIRRNLNYSKYHGVLFGLGACSADLFYFLLLSLGLLSIMTTPFVIKTTGLIGTVILAYFSLCCFRQRSFETTAITKSANSHHTQLLSGFIMTCFNPYTIFFWLGLSAQVVALQHNHSHSSLYAAGIGVMTGTVSWVLCLNIIIAAIKHKLSHRVNSALNYSGGILLLLFATLSFAHLFIKL
jgi:L-lysine exporter family protein LysE/ArgO